MTPSARLTWVRMYEQTGDAGLTCRRCGVSRPTLRKWWRRYQEEGVAGLIDRSRRPHRSPVAPGVCHRGGPHCFVAQESSTRH